MRDGQTEDAVERPLGEALRGYWQVRGRFHEAGLSPTANADPTGPLGEALVAAALWGDADPVAAVVRARECRTRTSDGWGPALGSMPDTAGGRRNTLAVDVVAPWVRVVEAVQGLAEFAERRRQDRVAWDRAWAEDQGLDLPASDTAYDGLTRVQVKARFTPSLTDRPAYDAVRYDLVRGRSVPDNDLFALLLFALRDEDGQDLAAQNFVGRCALITDEGLRALDSGGSAARLRWLEVHEWWDDPPASMPTGAYDVTPLMRSIRTDGW